MFWNIYCQWIWVLVWALTLTRILAILHTHGVGACCYSKCLYCQLENMFIGSLRQINTDSKTTPVGDFMQINQHEILFGVVSQCTIRLSVSQSLIRCQRSSPGLARCLCSRIVLPPAGVRKWSLGVVISSLVSSDRGILAPAFEPVGSFVTLTLSALVSTVAPSMLNRKLVSR